MKGKQLMDIINQENAKIFASIDSLFTPIRVKVDCNDLRDEVIYMCQGNMDAEVGIRLIQQNSGSFQLESEDDIVLSKSA